MDDYTLYEPSDLLHTQESISRYKPGGLHPVSLGDTFCDDRYEICHKLGWGGFSTVWLARDKLNEMWVSLKISSASEHTHELRNLQLLSDTKNEVYGVVKLLDHFLHQGPNGIHQCLVFELLGPTLDFIAYDYHRGGDQLPPLTILRIVNSLLLAISSIHDAGYVHGDISGSNLAFTSPKFAYTPSDDIFEVLGQPEFEPLIRLDGQPLAPGLPKQLVKTTTWPLWIFENEQGVRLIDFGGTFAEVDKPHKLAQPSDLRAPERIFIDSNQFDYTIDLWCTGCTIFQAIFGYRPFWYFKGDREFAEQMFNFIEGLPVEWQPKLQQLEESTGESWISTFDKKETLSKLEQKFRDQVYDSSLPYLLPIIQGLMRFKPSDRISAITALDMVDDIPYPE